MEVLTQYLDIVIVVICAAVGFVIKNAVPKIDNRFIPMISAVLGVVIGMWSHNWSFTPEILVMGLVSGLAATGCYELIRNLIDKFGNNFGGTK